jgi:cobyrinic acid a,c-diamide synthase
MSQPGLIIAAPKSGSGKTVVTLAILRALKRGGALVASAKAGPDYIDPGFHTVASGKQCVNLDCWAMRPEILNTIIDHLEQQSDIILCEGVMGLFDGANDGTGSTADLAAFCGWPVVLIVDARGQAASVAALLRGFLTHRNDVEITGIIFNRVGSTVHTRALREATATAFPNLEILGMLCNDARLELPERHLGLVQAGEQWDLNTFIDAAADAISEQVDLAAFQALARPTRNTASAGSQQQIPPLGQRIAVARDDAFAFCYTTVLEGWRRAGADLSFFSPLADEAPNDGADAIYLPGGYPELYAPRLAANQNFLGQLRAAASRGAAIYGECGGYMILGETLVDADTRRHTMAGLLPLTSSFAERRLHLGYRCATTLGLSSLGGQGVTFRGHEFHYASVTSEGPGENLFETTDARGENRKTVGLVNGRVAGSFIHLVDRAS